MKRPLIVLSGGQDSTTCLYWAKSQPSVETVHAVTFDYGQRHQLELEAAALIGSHAGVSSHEFVRLGDDVLGGTSPLTDQSGAVERYADADSLPGGLEKTFVPARNILFLAAAANRAAVLGCDALVVGVSQEDYGGYPDCREAFIVAMERAINEGLPAPCRLSIEAPLLHLDKRQTVDLAVSLAGCMDALRLSHTCYNGVRPPCGECHACLLRARGFERAGILDPLLAVRS